MSQSAEVWLWGRRIGGALIDDDSATAVFDYEPPFLRSGIQVAPLTMPLREGVYSFPELDHRTFKGLPGLLADSLPDRFGSAVLDTWLAAQGDAPDNVSAVERLRYTGARGMGALEFRPELGPDRASDKEISIPSLVRLASEILTEREEFLTRLREGKEEDSLLDIISVGASAGGRRAKAVIAWNRDTDSIRSGQVEADPGFEHWLLKFDGVSDGAQLEDPKGYGAIEFAYSEMAREAGIIMSECRLHEEGGRRHFMTRRFDRPSGGGKLHMQSLGGLAHYDFNQPGGYSYEQAMMVLRRLQLPMEDVEQQFRRMTFNVLARNQDDHVKNIAYLMGPEGRWSLSPAFDMTYSYRPGGGPTARHQMSLNQKLDGFTLEDFERCAANISMKRGRAAAIVGEVHEAVVNWPRHAETAGVADRKIEQIARAHRLDLPRRTESGPTV